MSAELNTTSSSLSTIFATVTACCLSLTTPIASVNDEHGICSLLPESSSRCTSTRPSYDSVGSNRLFTLSPCLFFECLYLIMVLKSREKWSTTDSIPTHSHSRDRRPDLAGSHDHKLELRQIGPPQVPDKLAGWQETPDFSATPQD